MTFTYHTFSTPIVLLGFLLRALQYLVLFIEYFVCIINILAHDIMYHVIFDVITINILAYDIMYDVIFDVM